MRYVLDTSAAVKCHAPEGGSEEALTLLGSGAAFTVPDIFPLELASGLLRKERRGELEPGTSGRAVLDFEGLGFELVPHAPMLPAATALASRHRHGLYDCLFLPIARDRALPVVTYDGAIALLARQLEIALWRPDT